MAMAPTETDHVEKDSASTTSASHTGFHGNGHNGQSSRRFELGTNPLSNVNTHNEARLPAFGGEFQPGLWKPVAHRKFANPAPLGLSAFALTTFVLSLINLQTRGVTVPNIVASLALGYGGLVQLLAGMWEMAVGNTFGATALSSYGGFWISYSIILNPVWNITGTGGPYDKAAKAGGDPLMAESALGFFLIGWFIFTTILLLCTLRSTVMFFSLFFTLDICFLMLACAAFAKDNGNADASVRLNKAGGVFGLLAAFLSWYNAFAGIADNTNSFFVVPVFHFPWSESGHEARMLAKAESATV